MKLAKHWPKAIVVLAVALATAAALAGTTLPLLKMVWG
jgi:hypothetical protein